MSQMTEYTCKPFGLVFRLSPKWHCKITPSVLFVTLEEIKQDLSEMPSFMITLSRMNVLPETKNDLEESYEQAKSKNIKAKFKKCLLGGFEASRLAIDFEDSILDRISCVRDEKIYAIDIQAIKPVYFANFKNIEAFLNSVKFIKPLLTSDCFSSRLIESHQLIFSHPADWSVDSNDSERVILKMSSPGDKEKCHVKLISCCEDFDGKCIASNVSKMNSSLLKTIETSDSNLLIYEWSYNGKTYFQAVKKFVENVFSLILHVDSKFAEDADYKSIFKAMCSLLRTTKSEIPPSYNILVSYVNSYAFPYSPDTHKTIEFSIPFTEFAIVKLGNEDITAFLSVLVKESDDEPGEGIDKQVVELIFNLKQLCQQNTLEIISKKIFEDKNSALLICAGRVIPMTKKVVEAEPQNTYFVYKLIRKQKKYYIFASCGDCNNWSEEWAAYEVFINKTVFY